jgi:hypothetical protein
MHARMQGRNDSDAEDSSFSQYTDYSNDTARGPPKLAIFAFHPRATINAQLDLCLVRARQTWHRTLPHAEFLLLDPWHAHELSAVQGNGKILL